MVILQIQLGVLKQPFFYPMAHMGQWFHHQDSSFQSRPLLIKLEFPRFLNGDDPLAGVYHVEHYIDYFTIDGNQKV